jgi:hypothetical protein
MAQIAETLIQIPCSKAAAERLFSIFAWLFDSDRMSADLELIEEAREPEVAGDVPGSRGPLPPSRHGAVSRPVVGDGTLAVGDHVDGTEKMAGTRAVRHR